jgi:hypothetical protein
MKETISWAVSVLVITGVIWGIKLFADSVSDYEVIAPKLDVECVVVSRMFNTSVDCWEVKK